MNSSKIPRTFCLLHDSFDTYPRTLNDRIYVKTSKMPTRDFCTKSVCSSCGAVEQSRNFPYVENTTRATGCSNGGSRTSLFPWAAVTYFDITAASYLTSNWSVDRTETEAELSPVTCKIFRHTWQHSKTTKPIVQQSNLPWSHCNLLAKHLVTGFIVWLAFAADIMHALIGQY